MLSQVFHDIEKKIITSLKDNSKQTPENLEKSTKLSPDQIRRGIEWLKLKELANVDESKSSIICSLGKNGKESLEKGLPERRLLDLLKDQKNYLIYKNNLVQYLDLLWDWQEKIIGLRLDSDTISLKNPPDVFPGEKFSNKLETLNFLKMKLTLMTCQDLLKRPDFVVEDIVKTKEISLSDSAKSIELSESSGAIDVEAKVPEVFVARTHPLKDTIDEIREIFVTLGFSEILET